MNDTKRNVLEVKTLLKYFQVQSGLQLIIEKDIITSL